MTSAPIPAGEEMDREVAERVMGWHVVSLPYGALCTGFGGHFDFWSERNVRVDQWAPSANIAHAWEVVTAMRGKLFSKRYFFAKALRDEVVVGGHVVAWPEALMLLEPVHICRAALAAMRAGDGV